jgi:hypothetical protein
LQRRTRNHICIWIICLGLINFFAYTVVYAQLGGDAKNGGRQRIVTDAGEEQVVYFVRGHFIRGTAGQRTDVPRWVWIYSYLHSISLWPTQAVMMISMLILARPHIIATMRESTWIRGPAFIAVAMTLIGVLYSAMTIWFVIHLVLDLRA